MAQNGFQSFIETPVITKQKGAGNKPTINVFASKSCLLF